MVITQKQGTLEYLVAEGISAPHCFTTRYGGVSTGTQSSLNIAFGRGDTMENVEKNLHILASALDFDPEKFVLTRQTHSDIVRVVTAADHTTLCHRDYPECDGLVTNDPGVALMVFSADCTPILFYDPVTGAVGAAHAGWRGTAADIGGKTVKAMADAFGCDPKNIRAAIGPNISGCCFETDADVPEAMIEALGEEDWGVPVVWNCGGYEKVETLRKLEGKVQVYLPDFKYAIADIKDRYVKCTTT